MKTEMTTTVTELYILPSNHMTEEIQMPITSSRRYALLLTDSNQPANL